MAAHLYLPTYKAKESRPLLWNGRPPGLVGFKVRDDDTGEDATGLRIPGHTTIAVHGLDGVFMTLCPAQDALDGY